MTDLFSATGARRAVEEMVGNGAKFYVQRRTDDLVGWTYELAAGGDRQRCREIIKNAKACGGAFWTAFVETIIEIAGGQP